MVGVLLFAFLVDEVRVPIVPAFDGLAAAIAN
jgi:hypothetical protein